MLLDFMSEPEWKWKCQEKSAAICQCHAMHFESYTIYFLLTQPSVCACVCVCLYRCFLHACFFWRKLWKVTRRYCRGGQISVKGLVEKEANSAVVIWSYHLQGQRLLMDGEVPLSSVFLNLKIIQRSMRKGKNRYNVNYGCHNKRTGTC